MKPQTLEAVAAAVRDNPALVALRSRFPDLHFTECGEDEVPARVSPAAECGDHLLYLILNTGHCIGFTSEIEAATGIVVAQRLDEF